MDRSEKQAFVASLRQVIDDANLVVVTRQSGLTVDESTALRRKMLEAGARYKVAKNTLIRLAVADTKKSALDPHLTGPTALAFSADPIAAARVAVDFAKANPKLEVVCGAMGEKFLDKSQVQALASLPSLDELRGKLIGVLQAPATKVAGVLQAPASQLARVFSAYGSKA
ncbi:MAG: 50S ribosomal protein L10 [Holosporales bacterium]